MVYTSRAFRMWTWGDVAAGGAMTVDEASKWSGLHLGMAGRKVMLVFSNNRSKWCHASIYVHCPPTKGEVSGKDVTEPSWRAARKEPCRGAIYQILVPEVRSDGWSGEGSKGPQCSGSLKAAAKPAPFGCPNTEKKDTERTRAFDSVRSVPKPSQLPRLLTC